MKSPISKLLDGGLSNRFPVETLPVSHWNQMERRIHPISGRSSGRVKHPLVPNAGLEKYGHLSSGYLALHLSKSHLFWGFISPARSRL